MVMGATCACRTPEMGGALREQDPQQDPTGLQEGVESVPDVSRATLLDLLTNPDPEIRQAVVDLVAAGSYRDDVLLGWNSFLQ